MMEKVSGANQADVLEVSDGYGGTRGCAGLGSEKRDKMITVFPAWMNRWTLIPLTEAEKGQRGQW